MVFYCHKTHHKAIGRVVYDSYASRQTDGQTDILIAILRTPPGREVIIPQLEKSSLEATLAILLLIYSFEFRSAYQPIVVLSGFVTCVYVCMFVSSHAGISKTTYPNLTKFLYTLTVAMVWSSADYTMQCYVLPVLWMVSCFT